MISDFFADDEKIDFAKAENRLHPAFTIPNVDIPDAFDEAALKAAVKKLDMGRNSNKLMARAVQYFTSTVSKN